MRSEIAEHTSFSSTIAIIFGVCGVYYALAVGYRKQTVAMIKQGIKKYCELDVLEDVILSMELA
jgi:hypothetical protein